jgi:hypothetical protein
MKSPALGESDVRGHGRVERCFRSRADQAGVHAFCSLRKRRREPNVRASRAGAGAVTYVDDAPMSLRIDEG